MKVLLFGNLGSVHVLRWGEELQKRGIEVVCVSFHHPLRPSSFRQIVLPGRFPFNFFSVWLRCWRIVRQEKPDLLHCHYVTSYGLIGALTFFKPLVVSAWGSDLLQTAHSHFVWHLLTRFTLRRAVAVFADSRELLEQVAKIGGEDVRREYVLWGVDLTRFREPHAFASSAARRFVSIRMHEPIYNIHALLKAFAAVQPLLPGATLEIAGSGSITDSLRAQSGTAVHFHGLLNDAEIAKLLQGGEVAISIPDTDGTAMTVLESMACGLPLICSDIRANREWLDEHGAVFVSAASEEGLKAALLDFYHGRYDLPFMGARNRNEILRLADRRAHFDAIQDLYLKISAER